LRHEPNAIEAEKPLFSGDDPEITLGGLSDGVDRRQGNAIMLCPGGMHIVAERWFQEV
jgi:hypothetical protein